MAVRGGLPFDWWLRRGCARCERGEKGGGRWKKKKKKEKKAVVEQSLESVPVEW
jgi:hypothetical protein